MFDIKCVGGISYQLHYCFSLLVDVLNPSDYLILLLIRMKRKPIKLSMSMLRELALNKINYADYMQVLLSQIAVCGRRKS